LTGTRIDQSQGNFISTERSLDVAIQGRGFFCVQDEGRTVYTRCGRLELDTQRRLCVRAGDKILPLQPEIVLPANVRAVKVETSGDISVTISAGEEKSLGRIPLVRFLDAHALQPLGDGLLAATRRSGGGMGVTASWRRAASDPSKRS
jgi:flagellar basal-body rod protein FlgG